jgi:hypothetical protein
LTRSIAWLGALRVGRAHGPLGCQLTLDFTEAVLAYDARRLDMDMTGRKPDLVTRPGIVLDADALALEYARVKLRPRDESGGRPWSAWNWPARSAMAAWWSGSLYPRKRVGPAPG